MLEFCYNYSLVFTCPNILTTSSGITKEVNNYQLVVNILSV